MDNLSIVVPCYNEQDTISKVIEDCVNAFPDAEIIIVNDKSTDHTPILLRFLQRNIKGLKVLTNKQNKGHAYSLLRGLKSAGNDYVLYMDADNQIKIKDIYFNKDFDLISGYRANRQDKFFRKVISLILKLTIFIRHGLWIKDANCPFKLFKRERLELLLGLIKEDSVVPSISMEILARKYHMKTLEIPVDHYPYIKERKGTLQSLNRKSIKVFWEAFREVLNP